MKMELPADGDSKVISIDVAKHTSRYGRRLYKECPHDNITVDPTCSNLYCRDCGKEINPVAWLCMLVEEWERVNRVFKANQELAAQINKKVRTKCRHCGEMTPVNV